MGRARNNNETSGCRVKKCSPYTHTTRTHAPRPWSQRSRGPGSSSWSGSAARAQSPAPASPQSSLYVDQDPAGCNYHHTESKSPGRTASSQAPLPYTGQSMHSLTGEAHVAHGLDKQLIGELGIQRALEGVEMPSVPSPGLGWVGLGWVGASSEVVVVGGGMTGLDACRHRGGRSGPIQQAPTSAPFARPRCWTHAGRRQKGGGVRKESAPHSKQPTPTPLTHPPQYWTRTTSFLLEAPPSIMAAFGPGVFVCVCEIQLARSDAAAVKQCGGEERSPRNIPTHATAAATNFNVLCCGMSTHAATFSFVHFFGAKSDDAISTFDRI
jgi:hypothetical protein